MNPEFWLDVSKLAGVIGGLVAILGTAGVNHFSKYKEEDDAKKIDTLLMQNAGLAASANRLETGNTELQIKIGGYQSDLAAKDVEIETLRKRADVTDASVEKTQGVAAAAKEMAQEQAPRRLSDAQIQEVLEILAAGEKGDFDLIAVSADPDTKQFAANLGRMLQHIGWRLVMNVGDMRGVESRGVRIGVADVTHPPARALTLHAALNQVGINARLTQEERHVPLSVRTQSTDYVELIIGSK